MPKPKNKSYKHETEVAKLFSKWWGSEFKRTPNSGALRWNGTSWTYSDVLPPDDCPVALECKIRASVDLFKILRPGNDPHHEHHPIAWWNQAVSDAIRCYEETGNVVHPLLVFRQDRQKNYVGIEADLFVALFKDTRSQAAFWVTHPAAKARFTIIDLATFFDHIDRDRFLDGARKVIPWTLVEVAA